MSLRPRILLSGGQRKEHRYPKKSGLLDGASEEELSQNGQVSRAMTQKEGSNTIIPKVKEISETETTIKKIIIIERRKSSSTFKDHLNTENLKLSKV